MSILLVDDDPGAIQLMGRILAGVGQLRFATNGNDALRLARESAPEKHMADELRRTATTDALLVARYGGEEFMILRPQTPRQGAKRVARQVLEAVADFRLPDVEHSGPMLLHDLEDSTAAASFTSQRIVRDDYRQSGLLRQQFIDVAQ